ncbi:hypothetical protein CWR43_32205 [Rhizobium sullae]|uniref:Acetyltransferase (GNAT) family protein n=1 Tax=Rhizobium sullae TaxID=50338 RepID=A0A2N0D0D4_RHISU|nr:GNAT family protein [Rhizobium sullae]PKA39559.1 hypothetical protein CWR43_32205 [Rhizobium sullae]
MEQPGSERPFVVRLSANDASRRAAARYGFVFEGVWRNAVIVKGFQRDVAWHSMLIGEWPGHKAVIEAWLDESNFGSDGIAKVSLSEIRGRRP